MATIITIGNVVSRAQAQRIDTNKLKSELKALRIGAGLTYAHSQRGGYDVWIEANDGLSDAEVANALSAGVMQAKRLRIELF